MSHNTSQPIRIMWFHGRYTFTPLFITVISALWMSAVVSAQPSSFVGLGDLPGGFTSSGADGVSHDGTVVVGSSGSVDPEGNSLTEAFRWTLSGGMEGLGEFHGASIENWQTYAYAVSADGSVIVGDARKVDDDPTEPHEWEGFRWTEAAGMDSLGHLPGGHRAGVGIGGVSADGLVIVGTDYPTPFNEAFRWESGVMVGLGTLEDGQHSFATGVSADGSVIVGRGINADDNSEAFRWTTSGGMEGLGYLAGGDSWSLATDASANGSVIVGVSGPTTVERHAFRWESGVMDALGEFSGGDSTSSAWAVSGSGSVIVGEADTDGGSRAFIWTAADGMRNLKDVLEDDYGLDLSGWVLGTAWDISGDGRVVVGSGTNPDGNSEAWRAEASFAVADEATPEELADVLTVPSPNPVRGSASLTLAVERAQNVTVAVFDALGRRVQTLLDGALAAGTAEALTFDASALPAGVYIIRATGEDFAKTRRVTVVR